MQACILAVLTCTCTKRPCAEQHAPSPLAFTPQGWRGWVCYNDAAPPKSTYSCLFGHCKGILAWKTDRLGWLVHSVPSWPRDITDVGVLALPKSAMKNGQSFVWLSLPRSDALTKAICSELLPRKGVGSAFHSTLDGRS